MLAAGVWARAALLDLRESYIKSTSRAKSVLRLDRLSRHEARVLEQLYRSLSPDAARPGVVDDPGAAEFRESFLSPLAEIGERGGPSDPSQDSELQQLYREIWTALQEGQLGPRQFYSLVAADGSKYGKRSPFYDILFQTAGYAGSSRTIQFMYDNMGLNQISEGEAVNGYVRFCNDCSSTHAVRGRLARSVNLALAVVDERNNGQPELASFAGGTAPFASMLFSRTQSRPRIHFLDMDPRALVFSARRARQEGFRQHLVLHCQNLLSRRFDVERLGLRDRFSYAECLGLFDYLPDRLTDHDHRTGRTESAFAVVLRKLFSTVARGGRLVIGNFTVGHPNRYFMELTNWPLILRDEEQLERITADTLEPGSFTLEFERVPPGDTQILTILTRVV